MLLKGLSQKIQDALGKLKKKGKLTEDDISKAMREVKLALLEADVNYKVVKDFTKKISERSIGKDVMDSLTPAQQVIKIVKEELTYLLGENKKDISFSPKGITTVMLVGLQGAGKTTTAGKIANFISKKGYYPLLVGLDVYRPAAIKQLKIIGDKLNLPIFSMGEKNNPVDIAKASLEYAKKNGRNLVIFDTAGRLHIDDTLMNELIDIKKATKPYEILLVVDSMTGQDAINVADNFNNALGLDGAVLTKFDGDARGGAALSIKSITNCPIKFVGTGEKLDEIEYFHPDRIASRILGMGDTLTLIEKAETSFDKEKAKELEKRIKSNEFTFEDFFDQLQQMKNMGSIEQLMDMIPGVNSKKLKGLNVDDNELIKIEAIINSMTKEERKNPSIIKGSRRKRIAKGSGTRVQDINKLLKQFTQTQKLLKQFGDKKDTMKKNNLPFF